MSREFNPKIGKSDAKWAVLCEPLTASSRSKVILFDQDFKNNRTLICDKHEEPLGVIYLKKADNLRDALDSGVLNENDPIAQPLSRMLRSSTTQLEMMSDV